MKQHTLNKTDRLKSRKKIEFLFSQGDSVFSYPFSVFYQFEESPTYAHLKTAFSVPKKNFKKAVDRNRIRRIIKESYRLEKQELDNLIQKEGKHLYMIIVYIGKTIPEYDLISRKMKKFLKKFMEDNF